MFFGKSLYELIFVDIPKDDINEFKKNMSTESSDIEIRNYLINYYIAKVKRYESLKTINNDHVFDYLIFKNSVAANLFDSNLQDFRIKYLNILLLR